MEGSGFSSVPQQAALVKMEPEWEPSGSSCGASEAGGREGVDTDRALKHEDAREPEEYSRHMEEKFVKDEAENVKEDYACEQSAAQAALYAGHEVKGELVLGPDGPQLRDSAFTLYAVAQTLGEVGGRGQQPVPSLSSREQLSLRDCVVRLERINAPEALVSSSHRGMPKQSKHTTLAGNEMYEEKESHHRTIVSSEENEICIRFHTCPICRKTFVQKSQLLEHVAVHIHAPPSPEQGESRLGTDSVAASTDSHGSRAGSGHCDHTNAARACPPVEVRVEVECVKEELEGEAPGRGGEQLALRDCAVRLERIHALEALVGSQQSTSTTQAGKGSDAQSSRAADSALVGGARALACPRPRPQRHTHHTQPAAAEHTAPAHSQNTHSCHICNKQFTKIRYLKVHRRIHTGEKPYSCEICAKQFTVLGSLKLHKLIHSNTRPYSCEICTKQFTQLCHLKVHKLIHTNTKPYSCEICTKQFRQLGNLKVHKLIHTNTKPYSCEICTKQFRRLDYLKVHKLIHTNTKPYSCEICTKQFKRLDHLKVHKLIHTHRKPYSCEICTKQFMQSSTLKEHKLIHTNTKSYPCEICTKQFRHSNALKAHKLIHTHRKPYSCEICTKQFTHLGHLKEHKLIHTNIKPYSCEICTKQFKQSNTLKVHKLIHTNTKSYSCEICTKQFRHWSTLKAHKLIHTNTKPYSCEICTKQFTQLGHLNVHKRIHTNTKPYSCEICTKQFRHSTTLKEHKLIHTNP